MKSSQFVASAVFMLIMGLLYAVYDVHTLDRAAINIVLLVTMGAGGFLCGWHGGRKNGQRSVVVSLYVWSRRDYPAVRNDLLLALSHETELRGLQNDPIVRLVSN